MTQHDAPQRPPAPRIVLRHVGGRTWSARTEGRGGGIGWGCALAALDYLAEAHTDACPPTYYLDTNRVRVLRRDCATLGVRVDELATGSAVRR